MVSYCLGDGHNYLCASQFTLYVIVIKLFRLQPDLDLKVEKYLVLMPQEMPNEDQRAKFNIGLFS